MPFTHIQPHTYTHQHTQAAVTQRTWQSAVDPYAAILKVYIKDSSSISVAGVKYKPRCWMQANPLSTTNEQLEAISHASEFLFVNV